MVQYIDKNALVAEIEKRYEYWREKEFNSHSIESETRMSECQYLMLLLNTFKVKEVNLKNELKEDWLFANKTEVDCLECMCLTEDMFVYLAKKYFALGLKAQKGEK